LHNAGEVMKKIIKQNDEDYKLIESPHMELTFDGVIVQFDNMDDSKEVLEYPAYFESKIIVDRVFDKENDLPMTMRISTDIGVVELQFTKQQAMILGDFLQQAKHIKEE